MINYEAIRVEYEKMYEDAVTVKRHVEMIVNGETVIGWDDVYDNIPCRISQTGLGSNGQTETTNDIDYSSKLFISPLIKLLQGDRLVVTRDGVSRNYKAGEPFIYPTHQEVSLQRSDEA